MVKMEEAVIARLEHSGHKFEVLVDPDLALELRKGSKVNFDELLAIDTIFKDAGKGEEASEELVKKVFGTTESHKVAERIIKEGHVQLTTEQRKKMLEQRRREVVNFIAQNALNPQTNAPHPVARIEHAMEEAKVQVDLFKGTQEQVQEIVKEIKKLIPISMEKLKVAVRVPASFSGKASAILHKYGVQKEEWQKDGALVAVLELPVGMKQELFNELNHLTHGDVETKILEERK